MVKEEKKVEKKKETKKTENENKSEWKKEIVKIDRSAKKQYFNDVSVTCICGNSFTISSSVKWPIKVDVCYDCHPAYTGEISSKVYKWRIEKFLEKQKKIDKIKTN